LREDPRIKFADDGSKTVDTDDWQVDDKTFQKSNQEYNFTIDLFASNQNKKCKRFYSNFYCPGTSGIDAFSHSWDGDIAWICPPIKEVTRIIRKLRKSRPTGMLFVPEWKASDYWGNFLTVKVRYHGRLHA
jgi:site-specific DNA-methyltransferase (adenine-specific)